MPLAGNRQRLIVGLALLLAVAAVALPVLALPAFLIVTLSFIALDGRERRLVGLIGGPLVSAAFIRFLLVFAVPNIVTAGERAAEDKAVSRLREIRWAEGEARDLKWRDANGNGVGEFVPMSELLKGPQFLLKPGLYTAVGSGGVVRTEAFDVVLYLPAKGGGWTLDPTLIDASRAEQSFVAYAWPIGERHGGRRAFFIDQTEQVCELNASPYVGPEAPPPADAALSSMTSGRCPPAGPNGWHVWKKKKAASVAPGTASSP